MLTLNKALAIGMCLALFSAFIGCAPTESETQADTEQIIADSLAAMSQVTSCRMDMSMPITMEIGGGGEAGKASLMTDGSALLDISGREMEMSLDMSMAFPGEDTQDVTLEVFIVDDWAYTGALSQSNEQWVKVALTEDMWQQQSQLQQQTVLLQTATDIVLKGSDTVNGVDCYLFEIVPDMAVLGALLAAQTGSTGVDLSQFDLGSIIEEFSVRSWLAKQELWITQTDVNLRLEIVPEELGATEADFSSMTMDIAFTLTFYDYNQPVSIVLPPEAAAAWDMTGSFSGG